MTNVANTNQIEQATKFKIKIRKRLVAINSKSVALSIIQLVGCLYTSTSYARTTISDTVLIALPFVRAGTGIAVGMLVTVSGSVNSGVCTGARPIFRQSGIADGSGTAATPKAALTPPTSMRGTVEGSGATMPNAFCGAVVICTSGTALGSGPVPIALCGGVVTCTKDTTDGVDSGTVPNAFIGSADGITSSATPLADGNNGGDAPHAK